MVAPLHEEWTAASRAVPCPICGKPDWCRRSNDARWAVCFRVPDGARREVNCGARGVGYLHRLDGTRPSPPPARDAARGSPRAPIADATTRDRAYRAVLQALGLGAAHRAQLQGRSLTDAEIAAAGCATLPPGGRAELAASVRQATGLDREALLGVPGFRLRRTAAGTRELVFAGRPGLLIAVYDRQRRITSLRLRLDAPPAGGGKYRWVTGAAERGGGDGPSPATGPYHPPLDAAGEVVGITEGELKALVASLRGDIYTVGVAGCTAYRAGLEAAVALGARAVRLMFDADWEANRHVARSLAGCARAAVGRGLGLQVATWDPAAGKGIDDVHAAGGAVAVLEGPDAVRFALEVAGRHGCAVPVAAAECAGWAGYYATRPETDYLADAGFHDGLAAARADDPAAYQAARAALKAAGFRMAALEDLGRAASRRRAEVARARATRDVSGRPGGGPRPIIEVDFEEHAAVDAAIAALAAHPELYVRPGGLLVHLVREPDPPGAPAPGQPAAPPAPLRLAPVSERRLREMLAATAVFVRRDGEGRAARVRVPDWLVEAVLARGQWPGLRVCTGIIEAPTLRPDGSLLEAEGYDPATGLIHRPACAYPRVPEAPTRAEAEAALARILDLVAEFPFTDADHRAAWLAALLTLVGRAAVDGRVPLFAVDANQRGTGKTLLADLIAVIATGRALPRSTFPDDVAELRKQLLALAVAGDRAVLYDDQGAGGRIAGRVLNAVLTAGEIRDRLLGATRMVTAPWCAVIFATGNNLEILGDTARRTVLCRLETLMADPEGRSDFRYPDLLRHAAAHRAELLVGCLTMLRAYIVAGRPGAGLPAYGSFGAWSALIRQCVHWLTGRDPLRTRRQADAADEETARAAALIHALAAWGPGRDGVTAAAIVAATRGGPEGGACEGDPSEPTSRELRDALAEVSRQNEVPTAHELGCLLRKHRGRVFGHLRLVGDDGGHAKVKRWRVEEVAAPCVPALGGPKDPPPSPASPARRIEGGGRRARDAGDDSGPDSRVGNGKAAFPMRDGSGHAGREVEER